MKKIIEINGKPMEFEATAMTDHLCDKIFGGNIAHALQHSSNEAQPENIRRIAFVMYKRAELGGWRAMSELTTDDYYDWLDSIDSFEIENNAKAILELYAKNKDTNVIPKNTTSPQAG